MPSTSSPYSSSIWSLTPVGHSSSSIRIAKPHHHQFIHPLPPLPSFSTIADASSLFLDSPYFALEAHTLILGFLFLVSFKHSLLFPFIASRCHPPARIRPLSHLPPRTLSLVATREKGSTTRQLHQPRLSQPSSPVAISYPCHHPPHHCCCPAHVHAIVSTGARRYPRRGLSTTKPSHDGYQYGPKLFWASCRHAPGCRRPSHGTWNAS